MECNRDEAVRARDLAEKKYAKQDFSGAKKFVLKAQQLYPSLEGLSQMLQVLEVHAVAQTKVGGTEMDWYGILQVDPGADDSTIKKQYRRLALLLHPDKNKSVGAEAAFKLIGEAFGILSDKAKRQVHDIKRGVKPKAPHVRVVMEPNVQNFQTSFTATSVPPSHNPAQSHSHHTSHTAHGGGTTFWTACPNCKMQYQYMRTYENFQLQCPKCKNVFLARDIHSTAASNGAGGFGWPFEAHRQDFNFIKQHAGAAQFNGATSAHGFMNGGPGSFSSSFPSQTFFSSAAAAAAAQSKVAAAAAAAAAAPSGVPPNNLAADVVQQTYAKVKRERVEAEKETKRKEKEELRKEKEEQKKAREAEKREAMDRLLAKRKENSVREESKRRVDAKTGRKLKRKKRSSDQEDDEELEDEDQKAYEHDWPGELPRRRSLRAKKSVATYKVDISDDSDLEDIPAAKRSKSDGEANSEDMKSEEDVEREAGRQRSENGTKGKSPADDYDVGANGGEELGGRVCYTDRSKEDPGSTPKKDSRDSHFETLKRTEGSTRGSKLGHSPGSIHKTKPVKFSQQDVSPSTVKDNRREGGEFSKPEDFRDEKSPSKSPRTLRMRVRSPKVPFHSQSLHDDDDPISQQRVSSPSPSEQSTPSSEQDSQILVPDPDFHDFDARRTENDIHPGQIWAVYDDLDGMPRFYVRISKVTTHPFKAHVHWLEHCPTTEEETVWAESTGLSITCGEFKMGKPHVMDQINTFSHLVLDKAGKGLLKIYPRKGQVWAVYKDPEQGIGPAGGPRLHGEGSTVKCDMVEILSEFCDKKCLRTGKLLKIRGFKTVFHRQEGIEAFRLFKPEELVRFSHSVPNQKIDDSQTDAHGIPRGSLELDPASTPLDFMSASDPSR
ncbi:unnamed protein product [Calypogeia fissa]